MEGSRESRLARALVEMAGAIAADTDHAVFPHVVTQRVVEVLDVTAAGLMLADDANGALTIAAWSDERVHALQQLQLRDREGPCLECWHSGEPVYDVLGPGDNGGPGSPWPGFGAEAMAAGFSSVHAFPLRGREGVVGAICMFLDRAVALGAADAEAGQAIADVTAIGILQQRAVAESRTRAAQLQGALDSRIVIEQAKGLLAGWTGIDIASAFELLRAYARGNNAGLGDVARELVDGRLRVQALLRQRRPGQGSR